MDLSKTKITLSLEKDFWQAFQKLTITHARYSKPLPEKPLGELGLVANAALTVALPPDMMVLLNKHAEAIEEVARRTDMALITGIMNSSLLTGSEMFLSDLNPEHLAWQKKHREAAERAIDRLNTRLGLMDSSTLHNPG